MNKTLSLRVPDGVDERAVVAAVELLASSDVLLRRVSETLARASEPAEPAVLAQVGRTEQIWRRIEAQWGLLSAEDVTRSTASTPRSPKSHTANLRRRHGLVGVLRGGSMLYPGFQVAPGRSRSGIDPTWTQIEQMLREADWSGEEMLLWAASPNGRIQDGRSPAEVLAEEPDAALGAALAAAAGPAA